MDQKPDVEHTRKLRWLRALAVPVGAGACMLALFLLYPSSFEHVRRLFAPPISNAVAADGSETPSAGGASGLRMADAMTAAHGMFVKDPYGCLYVFQYLSATLSVKPVLDEKRQPLCRRM